MKTLEQLKAHAYDCIANIDMWKKELNATNDKIIQMEQQMVHKGAGITSSEPTGTPMPENVDATGTNEPKE